MIAEQRNFPLCQRHRRLVQNLHQHLPQAFLQAGILQPAAEAQLFGQLGQGGFNLILLQK